LSKTVIDHVAGIGIIFRKTNPSEVFLEIKDDGYPLKVFRRCLNIIGGNWIGEPARNDQGPRDTLQRELQEELTLEKPAASTLELSLLGLSPEQNFYRVPVNNVLVTREDLVELKEVKISIAAGFIPFSDYLIEVPKSVLDKADPGNQRNGFNCIVSCWQSPLEEKGWKKLVELQAKFNNLSNESVTIITSFQEIVSVRLNTAFGNDWPLKDFFLSQGMSVADFPLIEGIFAKKIGSPKGTWRQYLQEYDITRKPI